MSGWPWPSIGPSLLVLEDMLLERGFTKEQTQKAMLAVCPRSVVIPDEAFVVAARLKFRPYRDPMERMPRWYSIDESDKALLDHIKKAYRDGLTEIERIQRGIE